MKVKSSEQTLDFGQRFMLVLSICVAKFGCGKEDSFASMTFLKNTSTRFWFLPKKKTQLILQQELILRIEDLGCIHFVPLQSKAFQKCFGNQKLRQNFGVDGSSLKQILGLYLCASFRHLSRKELLQSRYNIQKTSLD